MQKAADAADISVLFKSLFATLKEPWTCLVFWTDKSYLEKHGGSGRWSPCLGSPSQQNCQLCPLYCNTFDSHAPSEYLHFQLSYDVPWGRRRRRSWSWNVVLGLGEVCPSCSLVATVWCWGGTSDAGIFWRGRERGGGDDHLGWTGVDFKGS